MPRNKEWCGGLEGMLEAELEVPQWWVSTKGKFWKTLEDKFKFSCRDNGE